MMKEALEVFIERIPDWGSPIANMILVAFTAYIVVFALPGWIALLLKKRYTNKGLLLLSWLIFFTLILAGYQAKIGNSISLENVTPLRAPQIIGGSVTIILFGYVLSNGLKEAAIVTFGKNLFADMLRYLVLIITVWAAIDMLRKLF